MAAIVERVATNMTWLEHMKAKTMWGGSKLMQYADVYVLNQDKTRFELVKLEYPPMLYKIFDEIIANAIDHHSNYPTLVTRFDISFDATGQITIKNNGPGIPVKLVKTAAGVEMYQPQMIASEQYSGDNLHDDGTNTKGGTNGVGLKLTGVHSVKLQLETVDETRGLRYVQEFNNSLTQVMPPTITPFKKTKLNHAYTSVSFLPDYADFKVDIQKFLLTLSYLLESRAWQVAAYTNMSVYYDGKAIPIRSFTDYCKMFTEHAVTHVQITNSVHPWDICMALSDGKHSAISIVNGINVVDGGSFVKYLLDSLIAKVEARFEKKLNASGAKLNKNHIVNNLIVFFKGCIPSPNFSSQAKESIKDPVKKYAGYKLPDDFCDKIYKQLEEIIIAQSISGMIGDAKTRTSRGKILVDKYEEATFARDAKKCLECGLLIAEGDSAMGTVRKGLLDTKTKSERFNLDWFGIFSIKGVPVNGLKDSILKPRALQSKTLLKDHVERLPGKKLLNNERFDSLIKILNLDWHKSYETDQEFKTLRYGFIVAVTDQDLDGFNIFGLLATFIMTYWPHLVRRGFVRRLNTPIIRVYPKVKTLLAYEFYTEEEAALWQRTHDTSKYNKPIYYKGLATHGQTPGEVTQTFTRVNDKICTFVLDEQAIKEMYVYYGDDPATRKIALVTPVSRVTPTERAKTAPLSQHFTCGTKEYQLDNLRRKLPDMIDGLVDSRRKVLYTALLHGKESMRVSVLAGHVTAETLYHHGETSLYSCITRLAQSSIGARNLPLLMPLGQFGTRAAGYKDPGAPRYIFTTVNHRLTSLMFPKRDEFILKYRVEDGKRYEPEYYAPIIPYGILECESMPANGWAVHTMARDITDVFKNIRARIAGAPKCGKLKPWLRGFTGRVVEYKHKTYTVGTYTFNPPANTIHITELPYGKFSKLYLGLDKDSASGLMVDKNLIEDVSDRSTDDQVDILIYLKPGAYEELSAEDSKYGNETFDCFEDYFELKASINDQINLIDQTGAVRECRTYEQVFDYWFEARREFYKLRVERDILLIQLEILMIENIQRFGANYLKYKFTTSMLEEQMHAILSAEKYDKFNAVLLKNPKFTQVSELHQLITVGTAESPASYDYLCLMNFRELSAKYSDARIKELTRLQEKLKELKEPAVFPGANVWLAELAALEKVIVEGLASKWFYGEGNYTYA
jgi:DNA topoisomerase-2